MSTPSDFETVRGLARDGLSTYAVARATGIPRSTVQRWLGREGPPRRLLKPECGPAGCSLVLAAPPSDYAFLLGMYLGDGHIAVDRKGVQRLVVTCCDDYPETIREVEGAVHAVLPDNRTRRRQRPGCTNVDVYSCHLKCLFPQHGPGKKHERRIRLAAWQQDIVDSEVEWFIRGLLLSDGCRSVNRVKSGGTYRDYPRYLFSNRSADILRLFTDACDRLSVGWTQNLPWSISVARRSAVAALDEFVGPKR